MKQEAGYKFVWHIKQPLRATITHIRIRFEISMASWHTCDNGNVTSTKDRYVSNMSNVWQRKQTTSQTQKMLNKKHFLHRNMIINFARPAINIIRKTELLRTA